MKFKQAIEEYKTNLIQEKNDKAVILKYIDFFGKEILTRNNEIVHITSSSMIFNKDRSKVLMIYHNIYDTWTWTGGHADGEDDLLNIAIKEAKEETGLKNITPIMDDIASIDILPVWSHFKGEKFVSSHLHLNTSFLFEASECDKLIVNFDETNGVKWIDIKDIEKYSNEEKIIKVYNKLIDKCRKISNN